MKKIYKINYVDGPCGSGKTHALGQYIKQHGGNEKYFIITPSKLLADAIYKDFTTLGIENTFLVHSSSEDKVTNITSKLMKVIEEINFLGNGVIIFTQQAFIKIPFFENKDEWNLIVDEIPKVDKFYDPTLPYNHSALSQQIVAGEVIGTGLYEVTENPSAINIKNYDSMFEIVQPIINDVKSEYYVTYTLKKNWDRVVVKQKITNDDTVDLTFGNQHNKLYFLSLLQPIIFTGFKSVIMMGANFETSFLFKYWSDYCKTDFIEFEPITSNLRYKEYKNGHRLEIRYLQEEAWSKYSATKMINSKSRIEHYAELVQKHFAGKKFIFMTNNSDETTFDNGIKLPVISHGLNAYQDIHNVYFSPALNNQPQHTNMLMDLGFDKDFITYCNFHEILHQGVMRSSLRNPNATEPVTVIVPDKASAESLARLFLDSSIGAIDGYVRKVKALTGTNKNRNQRVKKLVEKYELNSLVISETGQISNDSSEKMITNPYNIIEKSNQNFLNLNCGITLLSDIFSKTTSDRYGSTMEFISAMKSLYTNHVVNSKDEVALFNGVTYKTNESRKLTDVQHASLVVVDIDNGDLSPDKFFDIFSKEHKHSFIMCNTFSRSTANPNSYRAMFFIDTVVNDDVYRYIQKYIQRIINQYGYITCTNSEKASILQRNPNAKFSGIDLSKTHTASFFYLPCQVAGREEYAFFKRGNCKSIDEVIKYSIQVDKVIQYAPEKYETPKLVYESTSNKELDKQDILRFIKNHPSLKHLGGHGSYGRIAASMKAAGFTIDEFIAITPFISKSKTTKKAIRYWHSWGKANSSGKFITVGTLLYSINYKKSA